MLPGGILIFAAAFANTGLIGMPLIQLLLGEEMLFLASIVELVNDVLIFTVGILLIQTGCGRPRQAALRGFCPRGWQEWPSGFLLFATGFTLPDFSARPCPWRRTPRHPWCCFGGRAAGRGDLRPWYGIKKAWILTALRLFGNSGGGAGAVGLCLGQLTDVGQTLLLLSAMPGGSCCALFTRQYGGDWGLATRCVMLSTLWAVVTVPLWLLVTIL